ncbi:F28J7.5 protein isoform 2 [Gossypium australe]|uniref:F28J7.5 protein isoform 2 n=1 Tax=Gossypium australe TaxID=47621 RepID=A0A5B6UQA7_9ROSI|nr:F28J7.5 protein isoform 2 [Gossypium australe]
MARFLGVVMLLSFLGRGLEAPYRIHTLFSVECQNYFDWQTVGFMHSSRKAQQPGPVTWLLNCTDEEKKNYKGMDAPTLEVPPMRRHPKTGDWYPAMNKAAGVVHWLKHSKDAKDVDWIVRLYLENLVPREAGLYLVSCDNILAKLHTEHPEVCNKVGGLLAMHIDDLRVLTPLWLSKTEEVHEDRAHWETNITGDIYGEGWISEMYGYAFGAAEARSFLPFSVGNRSFSKLEHHEDGIVYDCRQLFPKPPYPREVKAMEPDPNKRRGLFLSIECINTMNEGLLLQHARHGCPVPKWSKYLSFLKSKTFYKLRWRRSGKKSVNQQNNIKKFTLFSTECIPYFDWQAVGLMHSFHLSGQPENITRLLSCTDEDLKQYKVILDADMILRGPITPWEFKAARDRRYLIGCDNELSKIHTRHPDACDKVGGVIVMHIDDLWAFALLWLLKTEGVRADGAHYATNITGDTY